MNHNAERRPANRTALVLRSEGVRVEIRHLLPASHAFASELVLHEAELHEAGLSLRMLMFADAAFIEPPEPGVP